MKAAHRPVQRPRDARLLAIVADGEMRDLPRDRLASLLKPGDLVVANDAATLPASLAGTHRRTGRALEVRLAARPTLAHDDVRAFTAVVFGAGDHRMRTEDRPLPPQLEAGDALDLGPLAATVVRTLGHPRLVQLALQGTPDAVWAGIAAHGRPVQYAHVPEPLALWDVWTSVAARPVAFEPPSAGFILDWALLRALAARGVGFATLTHAAGLSSPGDATLDGRFPLDEAYEIPCATVDAIAAARAHGGRVIAIGTTVVRALEHAAARADARDAPWLPPGAGLATQRLGPATPLRVVDAIVSGTHEPGSSHHALLQAFAGDDVLSRADEALERLGYRTHEFGDSIWLEGDQARRQALRSNLNTATLASRLGQRRTARPAWMPNASRMRSPSLRASTSKSA
jgi:S-adenosylmethionine:tRNA ribosyltransferase-isomerase